MFHSLPFIDVKKGLLGCGCSLVVDSLPTMFRGLSLIPNIRKKGKGDLLLYILLTWY
jgi:hypothetical protein